jgi:hypothetical protein
MGLIGTPEVLLGIEISADTMTCAGVRAVKALDEAGPGVWRVQAGEGTAVGPTVPVTSGGDVFAVLTAIWSTVDGVRVSIDWRGSPDDMTADQALALAKALRMVASVPGPEAAKDVPRANRP